MTPTMLVVLLATGKLCPVVAGNKHNQNGTTPEVAAATTDRLRFYPTPAHDMLNNSAGSTNTGAAVINIYNVTGIGKGRSALINHSPPCSRASM